MTKSISSGQFAEKDTFIKGSDCQRLERRLQPRFKKNLISTQNKSKDLEEIGEFLHQRYRDLISSLADDPTYHNLNKKKKKIFVRHFIKKYSLFKTRETWIESIVMATENEVWFQNNLNFWRIPYTLVDKWFKYIMDHQVSYYDSMVLLGLMIIVSKYNSMKKKPPIIHLTCKLTGFEPKTVNRCIDRLKSNGAINYYKANKYSSPDIELPDWFKLNDPKIETQPVKTKECWGENLIDLDNYDEFQWIGYMHALPFCPYNPFIAFIYPNLLIHQAMLNTNLLIFSLFDKQQIWSLYKIWVNSNYTRAINNRYQQAKNYLEKNLDQLAPVFSSKHYKQIYQCSPILHFIAKRKRVIDFQVLYDNLHVQDALQMIHKKQLINLIEVGNIDSKYFLQCLESKNFVSEWSKRYSIENINPAFMFIDNVPNIIKESFISDLREMYETPLQRYLDAQKNHTTLIGMRKYLEENNLNTLNSNYKCLDIKTHRITFSNYPIQSIPKQVRSVITAPPGKVFLQIDLASAELAILKWFVIKYQNINPDSLVNFDLNYITEHMNLNRGLIKKLTYPLLYGASIKTMCNKTNQPKEVVNKFREIILKFPGIRDFRGEATDFAKKNYVSLPTALGHQFPIFGVPFTQGLSFIIQGTGAELLREWLMEIYKTGIATEISNVIHDEIILEVEEEFVFNRISIVNSCLEKATSAVLPGLTIETKNCVSNSWDKTGLSVSPKFINEFT